MRRTAPRPRLVPCLVVALAMLGISPLHASAQPLECSSPARRHFDEMTTSPVVGDAEGMGDS